MIGKVYNIMFIYMCVVYENIINVYIYIVVWSLSLLEGVDTYTR
jgi:hypothetical protein